MTHPPALASWLLRTFGSGDGVDTLLGDLTEEYRQGRSERWFWSQALAAVAVTFIQSMRSGPLAVARVATAGIALSVVLQYAVALFVNWLSFMASVIVPSSMRLAFAIALIAGPTVAYLAGHWTGSVVAALAPARRLPAVAVVGLVVGVMFVTGVPFGGWNPEASVFFDSITAGQALRTIVIWPGPWATWHLLGLAVGGVVLARGRAAIA